MLGLYRILFLAVELRTETLTLYTVNPFTKHVRLLGEDEANLSHFYPEYLSDLQGFQYRIVSISIDPLYIAGKLYGPEVNLMQDIVRYQNATYTLLIEQNRTDRFIERGLGDLSLSKSFLAGSSLRQHHAIPTHGGICVHIPAGDVIGLIHFFVKPFHLDVWMCVVASVAVIILCKAIFRGRISLNVGFFFGESSGNWARFSGYDRVFIVMLGLLILFCQTLYESQILSLIALRLYEKRIDTVAELFASDFQLIALPMVRKFVVAIFPEIEHRLPVHEHLPYGINTDRTHRISGDGRGWVDEMSVPFFSLNGSSYIAISPLRDGSAGHFRHLVHVHIGKKRIIPLTHGRFEVNKILHWDQANNFVYYLGIPEHSPAQQHLYRASSLPPKQGTSPRPPRCLTCSHQHSAHAHVTIKASNRVQQQWNDDWEDIEDEEEEYVEEPMTTPPTKRKRKPSEPEVVAPLPPMPCQYFTAVFAPSNSEYALIECLGPIVPFSAIYRIVSDLAKSPTQVLYYLQNNTALAERINKVALPQVKSFPVMISGGYHAQVRLFLPPGLREDEITRYPMIVHVYSGPGTQLVTDKWRVDWNTYLAGTKDYIVTQIDGRGSSGQGYQLLHEVYRRLGTVEVSDQLEVAEYLRDSLHFVDKRRVGIWGWSYGGYTAALAMASPTSLFQCGISVAPVTNWKLYDSTYTERYMGMPNVTDNYKGYEDSDLSKHAEKLRDKQFLMVHGTADDNVHFQQSMVFSKALSSKGALFKQLIYPDEGHNLAGVKKHLYRSMTLFLEDCFRKLVS
uniref:Venom dipeptidyl peptidase 4 n=1 Tax=Anopheles coluzzii TaxID=1518534 RepID=A0A8W7PA02_ANOCL